MTRNTLAGAVVATSVLATAAAPAAPCPVGSAEQWFTYHLDVKNCVLGSAEGTPSRWRAGWRTARTTSVSIV